MYKNLFLIAIGLILGIFIGGGATYMALKPELGDKYEIVKPKIRGDNNVLDVIQENSKTEDRRKIRRRDKRK
jgi:hypothetical protein